MDRTSARRLSGGGRPCLPRCSAVARRWAAAADDSAAPRGRRPHRTHAVEQTTIEAGRYTDRQMVRTQADRQADRHTGRQADKQIRGKPDRRGELGNVHTRRLEGSKDTCTQGGRQARKHTGSQRLRTPVVAAAAGVHTEAYRQIGRKTNRRTQGDTKAETDSDELETASDQWGPRSGET